MSSVNVSGVKWFHFIAATADASTSAKRLTTRTAKANPPPQEREIVDSDTMDDILDTVEESGGPK